jgi:hypothetical protein
MPKMNVNAISASQSEKNMMNQKQVKIIDGYNFISHKTHDLDETQNTGRSNNSNRGNSKRKLDEADLYHEWSESDCSSQTDLHGFYCPENTDGTSNLVEWTATDL